jgi:hypothetical protein
MISSSTNNGNNERPNDKFSECPFNEFPLDKLNCKKKGHFSIESYKQEFLASQYWFFFWIF